MIDAAVTVPVNPDSAELVLTRSQIWRGLVEKARDATEYLPPGYCSKCEVIAEGEDFIIRDACLKGMDLREFVAFKPEEKVTYTHVNSPWEGILVNELFDDEKGDLQLRFYCLLSRLGAEPNGEEEQRDVQFFISDEGYKGALTSTIAKTRAMVKAGHFA
jgi:hypothetical protein